MKYNLANLLLEYNVKSRQTFYVSGKYVMVFGDYFSNISSIKVSMSIAIVS